ncbi:MAG: 50S ribosomal protein L9 [Candidatus Pacebacteria bacterium]|nr:50S ribosomal protein L9 [Candidatus Paceibacterota bacterium]
MKVILLDDVPKIGKKYESKEVSPGYARNYLFPNKLAEVATKKTLDKIELLRSLHEEKIREEEARLMKEIEGIKNAVITLKEKANDKGYLFAGIRAEGLLPHIKEQLKLDLKAHHIILDKPLKELGEHTVQAHVQDKTAEFKVIIEEIK